MLALLLALHIGWGCTSVVQQSPSMHKTVSFVSSSSQKTKPKQNYTENLVRESKQIPVHQTQL